MRFYQTTRMWRLLGAVRMRLLRMGLAWGPMMQPMMHSMPPPFPHDWRTLLPFARTLETQHDWLVRTLCGSG